jgi:phosphoribosylformylglycinamidine (FGAM) synthase-like enzyme
MSAPIITISGTPRDTLMDEYNNAMIAVDAAIAAVSDITINRRDYLIGGSFNDAVTAQQDRIAQLEAIKTGLLEICLEIMDQ